MLPLEMLIYYTTMDYGIARRYKSISTLCGYCKREFHPHLGRPNERFCRLDCYYRSVAAVKIQKNCKVCGSDFEVRASTAGRYSRCPVCRSDRLASNWQN